MSRSLIISLLPAQANSQPTCLSSLCPSHGWKLGAKTRDHGPRLLRASGHICAWAFSTSCQATCLPSCHVSSLILSLLVFLSLIFLFFSFPFTILLQGATTTLSRSTALGFFLRSASRILLTCAHTFMFQTSSNVMCLGARSPTDRLLSLHLPNPRVETNGSFLNMDCEKDLKANTVSLEEDVLLDTAPPMTLRMS